MNFPNKPRGTQDIFSSRALTYQRVQQVITKILHNNNYQPMIFPTFEAKELFTKSLGLTTDIINKEMYIFQDRKGRELALRPEGTASVARLVLQNNLIKEGYPLKLFYWANMFRYERPQKGRYREFWQLGVELVNSEGVIADYQVLKLISDILIGLGINDFIFNLNYLGNNKTKENYKVKLRNFFHGKESKLCDDCKRRYLTNPLRIIDCSICQKNFSYPSYESSWDENNLDYVNELTQILNKFNFPYQYNHRLVRGLDYYTGLVFEVDLGTEKAVLGGGRYDNLYQEIGEKNLPAIGFAIGVERLVDFLEEKKILEARNYVDVFFFAFDSSSYFDILFWKDSLTKCQLIVDYNLEVRKIKTLPKIIEHYQPKLLILLNQKGLDGSKVVVKNCQTEEKEEFLLKKENLVDWVCNHFKINNNG
jgi:histidyl-tRNA synthetase